MTLPLYIYSTERPTPEQMELLRAAKAVSGVEDKCKPERALSGCGRVLSFEGRPDFYCAWVEPWGWDDPDLSRMVAWVLTGEGYEHYSTEEDWLNAVIGPGVKEVV